MDMETIRPFIEFKFIYNKAPDNFYIMIKLVCLAGQFSKLVAYTPS